MNTFEADDQDGQLRLGIKAKPSELDCCVEQWSRIDERLSFYKMNPVQTVQRVCAMRGVGGVMAYVEMGVFHMVEDESVLM